MESNTNALLEELTVLEANELSLGNAFHAFRFSASPMTSAEQQGVSFS